MKKRKYFRITFSCSEDELGAIRQTAKDCNLSMSMYCKKVVLGFRPKYRLTEEDNTYDLLDDQKHAVYDTLRFIIQTLRTPNHESI